MPTGLEMVSWKLQWARSGAGENGNENGCELHAYWPRSNYTAGTGLQGV